MSTIVRCQNWNFTKVSISGLNVERDQSHVWSGNWRSRIDRKLNHLGFADAYAFVVAHSGIPFGQLFRILIETEEASDIPIAYIQFQTAFFDEAKKRGMTREAVAETLVRRLRQHLRSGWNQGSQNKKRKMEVISKWELPSFLHFAFQMQIWDALNKAAPPDNWCPCDINDPIIRRAFEHIPDEAFLANGETHLSDE